MSSAEALVADVQATGNRKERMRTHPKCRYCSENHWSDECEKYATIEERKQKIKGSCYMCFNPTISQVVADKGYIVIIVSSGTAITEVYIHSSLEQSKEKTQV